jgi:hypothetical protein
MNRKEDPQMAESVMKRAASRRDIGECKMENAKLKTDGDWCVTT